MLHLLERLVGGISFLESTERGSGRCELHQGRCTGLAALRCSANAAHKKTARACALAVFEHAANAAFKLT